MEREEGKMLRSRARVVLPRCEWEEKWRSCSERGVRNVLEVKSVSDMLMRLKLEI